MEHYMVANFAEAKVFLISITLDFLEMPMRILSRFSIMDEERAIRSQYRFHQRQSLDFDFVSQGLRHHLAHLLDSLPTGEHFSCLASIVKQI